MRQTAPHFRSVPTIECLENRQFLSSAVVGSFAGRIPQQLPVAGESKIAVRLTNAGKIAVVESADVQIYASTTPTSGDLLLAGETLSLRLKARSSATSKLTVPSPTTLPSGNYFLVAEVDGNVVSSRAVNIQSPFSELVIGFGGLPGKPVEIDGPSAGVRKTAVDVINTGNIAIKGRVNLNLYLSADGMMDSTASSLATIGNVKVSLKPGQKKAVQIRIAVPPGTAVGGYFLIAKLAGTGPLAATVPANTAVVSSRRIAVVNRLPRPVHINNSVDVTIIDDSSGSYVGGDDGSDDTSCCGDPSVIYASDGYDGSGGSCADPSGGGDSGGGDNSGYDDSSDDDDG